MNYCLVNASESNLSKLMEYKLNSILAFANNLEKDEIDKINNYIQEEIPKQLRDYKIIKNEKDIIGAVLVRKYEDGVLLDEIYIEDSYRNKKIGSDIIKKILNSNNVVYLWVYKDNIRAYDLYKRLGFSVLKITENRYFMKYVKTF